MKKVKHKVMKYFFTVFVLLLGSGFCFAEEAGKDRDIFFLPLASYDYVNVENQSLHIPGIGFAVMKGVEDIPFDEVHQQFLLTAMYRPFFLGEASHSLPGVYHGIDFLFDGRWERHQFLLISKASSDKPFAGGLQTVQAGLGWGYEILRYSNFSFILGAAIGVSDFGIDLPNGDPLPVFPLPLVRLKLKTEWLAVSFDFLTGPNLDFTIMPERKIRFTANMRMDNYRNTNDLIGEAVMWYRPFAAEHSDGTSSSLGDFAGIGLGVKNESFAFDLSGGRDKTFEQQYTAVFGIADISVLQISGGYIFDSRELYNGNMNNTGKGFFVSAQGMWRF
jgi:hypothetical protein